MEKETIEIAELTVEELEERTTPGIVLLYLRSEFMKSEIVEIVELTVEELEERTAPGIVICT